VIRRGSSAGAIPARQLGRSSRKQSERWWRQRDRRSLRCKGPFQRPRDQAGRNASERRAGLERSDVGADPPYLRGRPPSMGHWGTVGIGRPASDSTQRSHRGIGDGMPEEEIRSNTGSPSRRGVKARNRTPARDRPGWLGWRTGPQYRGRRVIPAEGRGLSSRVASEGAREPGDWR
jgi:hypothetical protein